MFFDCINDEKDWFLHLFQFFFVYLQQNNHRNMSNNQQGEMLNRLKAVLADQGRTSRWLADQIGKSENTVSRWCANKVQPSIQQLNEIASILDVDLRMLIVSTKNNNYGSSDK